jgi:uncharacterized membrane protein YcaP (DUF421 family)
MSLFDIEWKAMFTPDVPLLETVVRGSVIYLAIFFLLRLSLRRTAGELTMLDFVFVLLAASAGADAMTGGSTSIINSVVLVSTIVAWNYSLNSLGYRIPFIERLIAPPPLPVIQNGRMLQKNMRREFLTVEELRMQLREEGIEDVKYVKSAFIEGDGNISVIKWEDGNGTASSS